MKTICFYHFYLHHKGQRATKHNSLQTEYTWAQKMPFVSKTRANLRKLISVLESAALNYPKFIPTFLALKKKKIFVVLCNQRVNGTGTMSPQVFSQISV